MSKEIIIRGIQDNRSFVNEIFSQSFTKFTGGKFIDRIADFMENPRTMRVSARDHFKSTSFYAHFLRTSMKNAHRDLECHYFSFQQKMAGYHINKIRQMKEANPYFDQMIDKKKTAENVVRYTWDGIHFHTIVPHGLLAFKRGIHADIIYVDDPFQDPANKLVLTIIQKVNHIIKAQILDMVKAGGQIHIAGTPQTTEDFFFDKELIKGFKYLMLPAIVDEANKVVLWEEWMDWDRLMEKKREKGEKIFKQEYLCSPVYTEEAFFKKDQIMRVVKRENINYHKPYSTENDVVAGFDIGKKAHPAHLAVFEKIGGKRVQLLSKWYDGVDYTDQVEDLRIIIENLGINALYYDNTRGEFESLHEQGLLPDPMKPIVFSSKTKNSMATEFEKAVVNDTVELVNDQRQIDQILLVDNDLNALETPQGHGDSFWSVALSFSDVNNDEPMITFV